MVSKKSNIGSNVVIKHDMAKAYDRISWSFTCIMLRRMGFNEMIIDMIWRTMSYNWYRSLLMLPDEVSSLNNGSKTRRSLDPVFVYH